LHYLQLRDLKTIPLPDQVTRKIQELVETDIKSQLKAIGEKGDAPATQKLSSFFSNWFQH